MSRFLTLEDVEQVCFEYAKTHLANVEPIPPFESRFSGKLESALGAPQQTYDAHLLYPTLPRQAAILFYEMIKLHPFQNGNKRIATVTLMVFLALNMQWLQTDWRELYDEAIIVASSRVENRDGVLRLLEEFIRNKIVPVGEKTMRERQSAG